MNINNNFEGFEDFEDEFEEEYKTFDECIDLLYNHNKEWDYWIDDETPIYEEIELYDQSITFDENFRSGKDIKFVLLPIFNNTPDKDINFTPLLNAGGKLLLKREELFANYGEGYAFLIVDYDSIFGIRLLSFQKYTNFFSCDERVLFETLLIKFHSFKFKEFFYSLKSIYKELGIKESRAKTILSKFVNLGIISKQVKKQFYKGIATQVTYFNLYTEKIIELLPKIYDKDHIDMIEKDILKYLEPAIKKKK